MKAFLEELRTQHIYRIAAGYMVAFWLILQIASLLCSALGLPSWTLKAILALILVGFGAALIIDSWIDLRAARLGAGGPRQWSRKVHLVFWPAGAMLIVGGTTSLPGAGGIVRTYFKFLAQVTGPQAFVDAGRELSQQVFSDPFIAPRQEPGIGILLEEI